uniref:Uncharacterized protein n=1 Tax=Arundo donax TaxID=35708 RepID=A0A0A9D4R1_ARUDO
MLMLLAHDHSICSHFLQVARIFLFMYVFYHIYLHYSQVLRSSFQTLFNSSITHLRAL